MDSSKQYRTDGGELMTDIGTRNRKLAFTLTYMSSADRASFWAIARGSGLSRPIFISMFPQSVDSDLEETHQLYGKFSSVSPISIPQFNAYSAPIEVEEL